MATNQVEAGRVVLTFFEAEWSRWRRRWRSRWVLEFRFPVTPLERAHFEEHGEDVPGEYVWSLASGWAEPTFITTQIDLAATVTRVFEEMSEHELVYDGDEIVGFHPAA
jgi:hypothetical protein